MFGKILARARAVLSGGIVGSFVVTPQGEGMVISSRWRRVAVLIADSCEVRTLPRKHCKVTADAVLMPADLEWLERSRGELNNRWKPCWELTPPTCQARKR